MIQLHPQFLTPDGKHEYVALPYEEFKEIQSRLEDAEDLLALELARPEDAGKPAISREEMQQRLGMTD